MKKISTIAVLSAMESELENFIPYMTNIKKKRIDSLTYHIGEIGRFVIIGLVTGIGQTNSAFSTGALVHHFNPDMLVFNGIAGAINKKLDIGDIVVGKTVFSAEILSLKTKINGYYRKRKNCNFPDVKFTISEFIEERVKKLSDKLAEKVRFGTFATSDFFPVPDYIPEKFYNKIVDTIDMESAAFYQVCKKLKKPCLAIRSISNYAEPGKKVKLGRDVIQLASKKSSEFSNEFILSLE